MADCYKAARRSSISFTTGRQNSSRMLAQAGAVAIDGVMMLVYQGAKALEIWTGKRLLCM